MKKILSAIVAALSALSFAAIVSAADVPATTDATNAGAPVTQTDQGTKPVKKHHKKSKKHHKKSKKSMKKGTESSGGAAGTSGMQGGSSSTGGSAPATSSSPGSK